MDESVTNSRTNHELTNHLLQRILNLEAKKSSLLHFIVPEISVTLFKNSRLLLLVVVVVVWHNL